MSLNLLEGYSPSDLGLDGFKEYRRDPISGREVQLEAIEFAAYAEKRFSVISVPTGIGKSIIAMSLAKLSGLRTVILTATKGLQDQYALQLGDYGLVDIRGRANYDCQERTDLDCRAGASANCPLVGRGCNYDLQKERAKEAGIVITNYDYWMTVRGQIERTGQEAKKYGENPVELLILDECHSSPDKLSDYLSFSVIEKEISKYTDPRDLDDSISTWKKFVKDYGNELTAEIRTTRMEVDHLGKRVTKNLIDTLHHMEKLAEKFERVREVSDDTVLEKKEGTRVGRVWNFDIIWPGRYAEQYLFCRVPKVVLMSATVRPKTMGLLGVESSQFEFREWPRIFPANRHPIYNIPAKLNGKEVRVDRRTTDEAMEAWVEHIDKIIDGRLDRKGLIQTVSYDRQKYLMNNSRHSNLMLGNTSDPDSATASEIAEEFRNSRAPCILVSPSFATGWDFEGPSCEYIIICKVPFKPNVSKVAKEREKRDDKYSSYMAMLEMVQSAGRGMRSAEDRCEVFVTDGNLGWFMAHNKILAPQWFSDGLRKVLDLPRVAEKLK